MRGRSLRRDERWLLPDRIQELELERDLNKVRLPAAAYCRLSLEGESMENQVAFVQDYIRGSKDLMLAGTYMDNGFTGTSFERSGWNLLMKDIQKGRIRAIVVKDLSRLGREYVETGRYIFDIFPKLGIRFIAITDNVDNAHMCDKSGLAVSVRNIMSYAYARDMSEKIHAALREKKRSGEVLGKVPYGYLRVSDGLGRNRLVIDETKAPVVRMMYQWAAAGVSPGEIAERLIQMGIPSPMNCRWRDNNLKRLLENPVYYGMHVTGCTVTRMYHRVSCGDEGRLVFENHHEAIVTRELWESAQERLAPGAGRRGEAGDLDKVDGNCSNRKIRQTWQPQQLQWPGQDQQIQQGRQQDQEIRQYPGAPLRGMLFCSVCGRRLAFRRGKLKSGYCCSAHRGKTQQKTGAKPLPKAPFIEEGRLLSEVGVACQDYAAWILERKERLQAAAGRLGRSEWSSCSGRSGRSGIDGAAGGEILELLRKRKEAEALLMKLFTDYHEGVLDPDSFQSLWEQASNRKEELERAVSLALTERRQAEIRGKEVLAFLREVEELKPAGVEGGQSMAEGNLSALEGSSGGSTWRLDAAEVNPIVSVWCTDSVVRTLAERIELNPDGTLRIVFKMRDEIIALLEGEGR